MLRPILAAVCAALALAQGAAAFEIDAMSPAERKAFRAEVRAYLLDHPEVLMEAVRTLEDRQAAAKAETDKQLVANNAAALFDDGYSWVGGNPEGAITLVEFMDYRCGYCRRAFPEIAKLVQGADDIRFVLKEFPVLGPQSERASRFAIATLQIEGDAAYKKVHDALMTMGGKVTDRSLRKLAGKLGLDAEAIFARMDAEAITAIIRENRALAQRLQIRGTPTFVLAGEMLRGYVPLGAMRDIVQSVRQENG